MIQAFYQTEPEQDTPYQQLTLSHFNGTGWAVRHAAGENWGRENSTVVKEYPVKDFDEGKVVFDRLYREFMDAGWMPYSPMRTWEPRATFQTTVKRELPTR